jgi:hypothetical protein
MMKCRWIGIQVGLAIGLAVISLVNVRADSGAPDLKRLERSFSIHASLATLPQGEWPTNLAAAPAPTEVEIRNAARLLTYDYAANRLYLIYQKEVPLLQAETAFQMWRQVCPPEVELVPALVLRTGQTNQTALFTTNELRLLIAFFKREVNPRRLALLNANSNIVQESGLHALADEYSAGLVCLGLRADESIGEPFTAAVEDAGTALCGGKSNEDWQQAGSGREALRKYVQSRNDNPLPVAWYLGTVATDQKNTPLSSGRNTLAANEILHFATPALIGGFSADLQTLQLSSRAINRDGSAYSLYEMLKKGHIYVGHYARPFHEVVKIYQGLRSGKPPGR